MKGKRGGKVTIEKANLQDTQSVNNLIEFLDGALSFHIETVAIKAKQGQLQISIEFLRSLVILLKQQRDQR